MMTVPRLSNIVIVTALMILQISPSVSASDPQLRGGRRSRNLNLEQGICHAVGGTKKQEYKLLSGIPIMALKNHMEQHGDGIPGGVVPDKPGCTFSPTCDIQCQAVCPCWPEGKPVIAQDDYTRYNSASNSPVGQTEDYWFRTKSDLVMRAFLENGQGSCELSGNGDESIVANTTLEEHEVCAQDVLNAVVENFKGDSVPPVCQPRQSVPAGHCPCWENVAALPSPPNGIIPLENYYDWEGTPSAQVDVTNGIYFYVRPGYCTGLNGSPGITPQEEAVCYNQLLEYARFYNSTNKCHDLWRDADSNAVSQLSISQPIRFTMGERQLTVSDINLFDYVSNAVGDLQVTLVNGEANNVGANVHLGDDYYKNGDDGTSVFRHVFCEGGIDSLREETPDAWFHIGTDGVANFTQNNETGAEGCEALDSALLSSQFPFRYLAEGESVEAYVTFAVLDTATGQTATGTLIVEVIGENDAPFLDGGVCSMLPFNEKQVEQGQTVSFQNMLTRFFSDTECNFPLRYGSIGNLTMVDNIVLPVDVPGENGGIYHFLVDGTVTFEDTGGGFLVGETSSIQISVMDSLGASGPLLSLITAYVDKVASDGLADVDEGPGRRR